jgi:hypothetical protein
MVRFEPIHTFHGLHLLTICSARKAKCPDSAANISDAAIAESGNDGMHRRTD